MQKPYFTAVSQILTIVLLSLAGSISQAAILNGRVVSIADGDTITVLDSNNEQFKIRLMGIDAPEKKQPFGQRSKQHLSALVFGKTVDVEWFKKDRYRRTLGKILFNGRDVNQEQIKAGMAWHYKKYQKDQPPEDRQSYADSETNAQQRRVGLWGDAYPVAPWDFRHK